MNAVRLLQHFERISEAPDAVPQLRRFILELAVRGKLVEQDPKDEPALELLKRIGDETDQVSFPSPDNWVLAKAGSLLNFQYGKALPASDRSEQGRVRVFGSNGVVGYCEKALAEEPAIIVGRKGSAGALNLCDGPSWTTDVAYFLIPPAFFHIRFLFFALQTLDLGSLGKGVKPGLSRAEAYERPIAVPPLAEQHRIVAKVDELMAQCDRLEAAQAERENRRDRLAAASLHRLNNGADAESFREHARFHLRHFPNLTTRPEHIHQLRRTILNFAVRGGLVAQDPNDEPAAELLKRIRAQKKLHRSKNSNIDDSDSKFVQHLSEALPPGWTICPIEDLFRFIDYRGRTPIRTSNGVRLITAKNVRMGFVANDPIEFVAEQVYEKWMTRGFPKTGDLLFVTEGATMGFVAMLDLKFTFALAQRTIDLQPYLPGYGKFFLYALMSPDLQTAVLTNATGTAVKGIKAAKLKRIRVHLPPLAEQHRIVARVEELLALCDRLEAQLSTTQTESRRLLAATLHEALAGKRNHQEVAP